MNRMNAHERFWQRTMQVGDCIEWMGYREPAGYGRFGVGGKAVLAHRFSYEEANGPIPADMEIDHLCKNRACVKVAHLEAVSKTENRRRSDAGARLRERMALITHCPQGHPYSDDNIYLKRLKNGYYARQCRECGRIRQRAYNKVLAARRAS